MAALVVGVSIERDECAALVAAARPAIALAREVLADAMSAYESTVLAQNRRHEAALAEFSRLPLWRRLAGGGPRPEAAPPRLAVDAAVTQVAALELAYEKLDTADSFPLVTGCCARPEDCVYRALRHDTLDRELLAARVRENRPLR